MPSSSSSKRDYKLQYPAASTLEEESEVHDLSLEQV